MNTQILNENEKNVLIACKNEIIRETECEYGLYSNIKLNNINQNQLKGYLSQLIQKEFITIYYQEEFTQIYLTEKGCEFLLSISENEIDIKQINHIKENI